MLDFNGLLDRTVKLAQDFLGDIVGGAVERARRAVVRSVVSLGLGVAGIVLALVFGAIGLKGWLETLVPENRRWAAPMIVAAAAGAVGLVALRVAGGRDRD